MKGAIHQPHYFPWIGYFDKIAKVDKFVIMDQVQLEDKSYMCRNRFVTRDGDLSYLTITCSKKGYREKEYKEIEVVDCKKWQNKHFNYFKTAYRYNPHLPQILDYIEPIFTKEYKYLSDVTFDSILATNKLLNIPTQLIRQSQIELPKLADKEESKESRRSGDVLSICLGAGMDNYLTGAGASLSFLNPEEFRKHSVTIFVQDYQPIVYEQKFTSQFQGNISSLDFIINCGIEKARELFWENIEKEKDYILKDKVI